VVNTMSMFKKIVYYLSLFFIVSFYYSTALDIKLELYDVQKPDQSSQGADAIAYIGEQFGVKIELKDVENNTGSVGLEVDGLNQFHGVGQNLSKSYSSINGHMSVNLVQEYSMYAEREGVFTIGPARATHQGKQFSSHSFKIRAVKRPESSQQNTQSGQAQKSGRDDFFCKLVTPKKAVFINEPIEISLLIYHRSSVHDFGFAKQPVFAGFTVKEVAQMSERQETIDGKIYTVKDKKFVLFPTKQGVHTIAPVHFAYNIAVDQQRRWAGSGFEHAFIQALMGHQLEQRRTVSNSLDITVKSLPTIKDATKTHVDAVGNFTSFSATVDKHDPVANEQVVLTLAFEGKTDFERLSAPKLRLPKSMKFYASKTDIQEDFSTQYVGGKKRFEFVVQIPKPGACEIPAQELHYFDTIAQTYKVLATSPIALTVLPAPDEHVSDNQKTQSPEDEQHEKTDEPENKQIFAQDVNFIEEDIRAAQHNKITSIPWWVFLLFLLVPVIGSRILLVRQFAHRVITRVRFGSSKTQHLFLATQHQLTELEKKSNAKPLYNLMIQFLAVRFDVAQDTVTEHWLELALAQEGWSREKVEEFITYLHDCAGLYFSSLGMNESQQRDLLKRGSYWLLMLNK